MSLESPLTLGRTTANTAASARTMMPRMTPGRTTRRLLTGPDATACARPAPHRRPPGRQPLEWAGAVRSRRPHGRRAGRGRGRPDRAASPRRPGLLVRRERGLVTSRVLAGTIRRTGDETRDDELAGALSRS